VVVTGEMTGAKGLVLGLDPRAHALETGTVVVIAGEPVAAVREIGNEEDTAAPTVVTGGGVTPPRKYQRWKVRLPRSL
jgi:hypothetical protein